MSEQIYFGNFSGGLKLDRTAFNIDNKNFANLFNAYSWRGRAKRKRGTSTLARLQRQVQIVASAPTNWQYTGISLTSGSVTLVTALILQAGLSIVPGTIKITTTSDGQLYTDTTLDGILSGSTGGTGTINYSTSVLFISGGASSGITGKFSYYPDLPVLGLEDLVSNTSSSNYPLLQAFDTTYSYQLNQSAVPFFYTTNYYKGTNTPFVWSNTNAFQFWSTNYQSAFWVTNDKAGFHFVNGTYGATGSGTPTVTFNFKSGGNNFLTLIDGDQLWFNEWNTGGSTINGLVGTVSTVSGAGNYIVTFTGNQTVAGTGIAQLLTNSIPGQDGIKWYDGDPTNATGLPTGNGLGWVNFAPPLTALSTSINDQQSAMYYLVGALAILPFKDRLLFFAPIIQTSSGVPIQTPIQDMVLWSWNGTPYYNSLVPTAPQTNETFDIRAYYVDQTGFGGYLPLGTSQPLNTIINNEDVLLIGFGGGGKKTRFVYTGNDLQPFLFYLINSELPSTSTFSSIALDKGGIDIGEYGIALTTQQSSQRIDLDIPDSVFQIQSLNNGVLRVNAIRDFYREWIYFSYPTGDGVAANGSWIFPSQSFLFNYRDNTWAIFRENFTHHGTFRKATHYTWATLPFKTWAEWREPWNAGSQVALFPDIIAGNPQGYVVIKDEGTQEAPTGYVQALANDGFGFTQVTSINHCVNSQSSQQGVDGDYLFFGGNTIGLVTRTIDANNFVIDIPYSTSATITGATQASKAVLTIAFTPIAQSPSINSFFIGQTVSISGVVGMTQLNGNTYTIMSTSPNSITLNVDSTGFSTYVSGGTVTLVSYIGLANYTRLSQPLIQTKQFPFYWDQGRKVRVGVQKYLMDYTANAQVTVNINLSQDPDNTYNQGPIVPSNGVTNRALVYSQLLYTCPESTNIGLTPANTNLQMPTAIGQSQIWHRMNTSLQGDTFQIGITLSDAQMRNLTYATSEIVLHGMHFAISKGPHLS